VLASLDGPTTALSIVLRAGSPFASQWEDRCHANIHGALCARVRVCVCVRALVAFQATELIKSGAIAANVTVGLVFTAYSGTSMEVSSLFDVGVP
jgi:hypothetical protein